MIGVIRGLGKWLRGFVCPERCVGRPLPLSPSFAFCCCCWNILGSGEKHSAAGDGEAPLFWIISTVLFGISSTCPHSPAGSQQWRGGGGWGFLLQFPFTVHFPCVKTKPLPNTLVNVVQFLNVSKICPRGRSVRRTG